MNIRINKLINKWKYDPYMRNLGVKKLNYLPEITLKIRLMYLQGNF